MNVQIVVRLEVGDHTYFADPHVSPEAVGAWLANVVKLDPAGEEYKAAMSMVSDFYQRVFGGPAGQPTAWLRAGHP